MKNSISSLLLLVAGNAFAQNNLIEEETPEVRRYTVEMIIFSYAQNVSAGSEVFVPDLPPPVEVLDIDDLSAELALQSIPEIVAEPEPEPETELELDEDVQKYELVMLSEDDYQLVEAFDHLQRLDAYEPLLHFGWTQPTYPEEDTEVRPLNSLVTPPEGLEGEFSLYLSRYLHLAVNLQLAAPSEEPSDQPETRRHLGDREPDDRYRDYDNDVFEYPVHYRIDEDRIFRNGELRYYDHPKFGVLAKITRVEKDEADEELFEDGELLGDIELVDGE